MRIYEHKPQKLLRIHISKIGEEMLFISVVDATMNEFIDFVKGIFTYLL